MSDWPKTDAFLTAKGIRIAPPTPCSTDGAPAICPMHAGGTTTHPTSWHYRGTARDYGDAASDCRAIADALRPFAQGDHHILNELFYAPTGDWWKDGRNLTRAAIGDHDDHVHASILTGQDFPAVPTNPTEATLLGYLSAIDPDTDGIWFCDPADGATYAFARDGSPTGRNLGALNTHPDWHAGVASNPVVGFDNWKDDAGKNGYQIWTREPNNGSFHRYGFPADGSAR